MNQHIPTYTIPFHIHAATFKMLAYKLHTVCMVKNDSAEYYVMGLSSHLLAVLGS